MSNLRWLLIVLGTLAVLLQAQLWLSEGGYRKTMKLRVAVADQRAMNERLRERNAALDAEVAKVREEHAAIRALIQRVREGAELASSLNSLGEALLSHVRAEERGLFERAQEVFGDEGLRERLAHLA